MLAEIYTMDQAGEEIPEDYFTAARGVYMSDVAKWPGGNIRIAYDQAKIDEDEWDLIYEGITQWQTKSNNSVHFTTMEPNALDWFLRGILLNDFVWITVGTYLGSEVSSARSNVGAGPWVEVKYSSTFWDDLSSAEIRKVASHEWGHVLGLMHEHQRPDRDNYITIMPKPDDITQAIWDANFGKLENEYFLWVLTVWPITVGFFDYESIMIYSSPYCRRLDGGWISEPFSVSTKDGQTIDAMY